MEDSYFFFLMRRFCITAILVTLVLSFSKDINAQEVYVVHLKDGTELIGTASLDMNRQILVIKTIDDDLIEIPYSQIDFISGYGKTFNAPDRNLLVPIELQTACRDRMFPYLELNQVLMTSDSTYYGLEGSIGFRLSDRFSLGIGTGAWYINEYVRYPFFLHMRYDLSNQCYIPFFYLDVGYIYDDFGPKPSIKEVMDQGLKALGFLFAFSPKLIGFGFGLDLPVTDFLGVYFGAGYRQITVATADNTGKFSGYKELHSAFLQMGIVF